MVDPIVGLAEMARVTRSGGVVAACVWDHAEGGGPLSIFWEAVHQLDPDVAGEAGLPGTRRGHLAQLFRQAGMPTVEETMLTVTVTHSRFDDWWEPYTLGVGPAGSYLAGLDEEGRTRLAARCRTLLPPTPFEQTAVAWASRAVVSPPR